MLNTINNMINTGSKNLKNDISEKTVCCVIEDGEETKKQAEGDNDLDIEQPELKIF